jgi:hypothetical protein
MTPLSRINAALGGIVPVRRRTGRSVRVIELFPGVLLECRQCIVVAAEQ